VILLLTLGAGLCLSLAVALLLWIANDLPNVLLNLGNWISWHRCLSRCCCSCGNQIPAAFHFDATKQPDQHPRPGNQSNPDAQQVTFSFMQGCVNCPRSNLKEYSSQLLAKSTWAATRCQFDRLCSAVESSFWALVIAELVDCRPYTLSGMPDWRKC
jgi:hypothetical protein